MKAITLWQPWASLIALGHKTIETLGHDLFKGLKGHRIAIHAGNKFQPGVLDYVSRFGAIPREHWYVFDMRKCSHGVVVCTAIVSDTRWLTAEDNEAALCECDDYSPALREIFGGKRFGLILTDVQLVTPPIPAKGHQGIWEWEKP